MWLKTEYGRLVNLTHVYTLRVLVSEPGFWVQGWFGNDNTEPIDLTKPRPEAEARRALDLIGRSIASGKLYLDLQNPPA